MQITALTMPPFLTLAVHDHRAATLTCDDGNDNTQRPTDPCRNWCGGQGGRGRAGLSAVGNHTRDANTALLRRFRSRGAECHRALQFRAAHRCWLGRQLRRLLPSLLL